MQAHSYLARPGPVLGLRTCRAALNILALGLISTCHCAGSWDTILTWAVSPFVLGGICIILAFLLSLTHSQRRYYERDREKVRTELETFRREVKAKVRAQASTFA